MILVESDLLLGPQREGANALRSFSWEGISATPGYGDRETLMRRTVGLLLMWGMSLPLEEAEYQG